jgi:uncharacterized protein involved in tolerance to divalent cations
LTIIGQNTTDNVNVITVPKTTFISDVTPKIYVNSQLASVQGFSQDSNNYYVWYGTIFRDYELSIVFTTNASPTQIPSTIILSIVVIVIFSVSIAMVLAKRRRDNCGEDNEYSTYG